MGIIHLPAGKTALASACGERFDPQQVCVADGPVTWEFTLVSNNAQYALWASTCPNTIPGTGGSCGTTPGGYRDPNGPDIDNQTLNAQLYCWGSLGNNNNSTRSFQYQGAEPITVTSIRLFSDFPVGTANGPDFTLGATVFAAFNPATGIGALPAYEASGKESAIGHTTDRPRAQIRILMPGSMGSRQQKYLPTQVHLYQPDADPASQNRFLNDAYTGFRPRPIDQTYTSFAEAYVINPGDWIEFRFYAVFQIGAPSAEVPEFQLGDIDVTVTGFVA